MDREQMKILKDIITMLGAVIFLPKFLAVCVVILICLEISPIVIVGKIFDYINGGIKLVMSVCRRDGGKNKLF